MLQLALEVIEFLLIELLLLNLGGLLVLLVEGPRAPAIGKGTLFVLVLVGLALEFL